MHEIQILMMLDFKTKRSRLTRLPSVLARPSDWDVLIELVKLNCITAPTSINITD